MSDAVFFATVGLLAAGAIALALVWPQGLGAPSPAPFGHPLAPVIIAPPPKAPAPVANPAILPIRGDLSNQLKGAL